MGYGADRGVSGSLTLAGADDRPMCRSHPMDKGEAHWAAFDYNLDRGGAVFADVMPCTFDLRFSVPESAF